MKTKAGVRVKLRAFPWPNDGTELRTHNARVIGSRVETVIRLHIEVIDILAQAKCRSQSPAPLDLCLTEEADRRLSDAILADAVSPFSPHCMVQGDVANGVVPDVTAECALQIEAADLSKPAM